MTKLLVLRCTNASTNTVEKALIFGQNWLLVRLAGHDEMTSKKIWQLGSLRVAVVGV